MAELRTDYKDQLLDLTVNQKRKYRVTNNEDGTISLDDVSIYSQIGDEFGAEILNKIVSKLGEDGTIRYNETLDVIEVFYNGEWVEWEKAHIRSYPVLQNSELIPGYSIGTLAYGNASTEKTAPTVNGTTVSLPRTNQSLGNEGTFYITSIDLTNYHKLTVEYKLSHGYTGCQTHLYLMQNLPSSNNYNSSVAAQIAGHYGQGTFEDVFYSESVDVTTLTGRYYLVGWIYLGNNVIKLENVYLN